MKQNYDVTIVGAGPGGATLAYELATKGIRVLLLEKETLPRYKCCAGGITVRAAKLLNFDIQELAEDVITDVAVTFKGDSHYHGHSDQALIYTVMRDKFDHALVKRAEEAGAVIIQGQKVKRVSSGAGWAEVSTTTGDFRSQYVAGADGAHSVVARGLGLRNNKSHIVGIEAEIAIPKEELARWKSLITVDLWAVPGGCAWVFPKQDLLSIGIACINSRANYLKRGYQEFMKSLNISHYTIKRWGGALIPTCGRKAIACRDRTVLIGDAAGLADPLSGEGIHNAVYSAKLAAAVIEESLLHGETRLNTYQQLIDEKIMPEIKISHVLARIFVQFPGLAFNILNKDERIWRGCCYLVRGEIDFTSIKQRLGGFKGMFALLSRE